MHSQRGYPSSPNGLNWFVTILLELFVVPYRLHSLIGTIKLFQCPIKRKTIFTVLPFSILPEICQTQYFRIRML
jgi:hypothetical protein